MEDLADNSVRADELADSQVRSQEIGNGQVQAEDLAPGVAPGASGTRAWGLVDTDGTLLRSKNVTAVTKPTPGVSCVDPGPGIDPNAAVMVVGQDFNNDSTSADIDWMSHSEWDSTPFNCGAGMMEVRTFLGDGDPASGDEIDEGGFNLFVVDTGFTFVIP